MTGNRKSTWRLANGIVVLAGVLVLAGGCSPVTRAPAPASQLGDADRELMANSFQTALETSKTGESVGWSNAESGHRGTILPVRTFTDADDRDCRAFQQSLTIGDRTEVTFGEACRRDDGTWRLEDEPVVVADTALPRRRAYYYDPYPYYYYHRRHGLYAYPYYPYGYRYRHGLHLGFHHHFH